MDDQIVESEPRIVTQADVNRSRSRLLPVELEWQTAGSVIVTDVELDTAKAKVAHIAKSLRSVMSWRYRLDSLFLMYCRAASLFRMYSLKCDLSPITGIAVGSAILFVVTMLFALLFLRNTAVLLTYSAIALMCSSLICTLMMYRPKGDNLRIQMERLSAEKAVKLGTITQLKADLKAAKSQQTSVAKKEALWSAYQQELTAHQLVVAAYQDLKNQLHLRDWRSLRGIEFENYYSGHYILNILASAAYCTCFSRK